MKKILLINAALFLGATTLTFAQNLVPNPSFETQDTCPAVSQIMLAPPWNSASLGSPDLFNSSCATQNLSARTGVGSSGVYAYIAASANNREYIQAPLNSTLIAGQGYCVSFYVRRSNYRYATNRIGAFLSDGAINVNSTSVINETPQVENNPNIFMSSSTNWTLISGSFIADGNESHIIIGNFASDADTDTTVANASSSSNVAFYRIDDISVTQCNVGVNNNAAFDAQIKMYPSPASSHVSFRNYSSKPFTACELVNLSGQIIYDFPLDFVNNEEQIDIQNVPNGTYIVRMYFDDEIITKKLTIVR